MTRPTLRFAAVVALGLVVLGLAGWGAYRAFRPAPVTPKDDAPAQDDSLEGRFTSQVRPFLDRYCLSCHGPTKPEAMLDLSRDVTASAAAANLRHWELVRERLIAQEMPPDDAPRQPSAEERATVVAWIGDLRDEETRRIAGDPGRSLARRLSNAEYDNTIRDLTGIDVRPTRTFPVDPANEAGFDNSGESLAMSPA